MARRDGDALRRGAHQSECCRSAELRARPGSAGALNTVSDSATGSCPLLGADDPRRVLGRPKMGDDYKFRSSNIFLALSAKGAVSGFNFLARANASSRDAERFRLSRYATVAASSNARQCCSLKAKT